MRAVCESCDRRQPVDWRPGDLCVHCGRAVREENRCYWCARWVPAGNFCRGCGAEGIPPDLYAPARMMKFYGADMFSIPRMLREMDPARVDTFRAVYGRHQAVAMRHVDELREIESQLFDQHWSAELEEQLIPQLPWPDEQLNSYAKSDGCGRNSPFPVTRALADLVTLRSGDFTLLTACCGLVSPDALGLEAALQLANWRVAGNTYLESSRYAVLDRLRAVPDPQPAIVRLSRVYLGDRDASVPEDAITSADPEIRFFAALLAPDERILEEALRSPEVLQQNVAAYRLIRLGRAELVRDVYASADPVRQKRLLDEINITKKAVPELHDVLFETIHRQGPADRLSHAAARAICLGSPSHAVAMRLAELHDWDILHVVALAKLSDPETYREIGEMLVREDKVNFSRFAWTALAGPGRMPHDFVERVFDSAPSAEAQKELLRFAEKQLDDLPERPEGTSMERVLINTAFGDYDPGVIAEAWAGIHRINYHRDYGSISPFPFRQENIERFWPMHEFERRLARLQSNEEALKGTFVKDELDRFLRSRDR